MDEFTVGPDDKLVDPRPPPGAAGGRAYNGVYRVMKAKEKDDRLGLKLDAESMVLFRRLQGALQTQRGAKVTNKAAFDAACTKLLEHLNETVR